MATVGTVQVYASIFVKVQKVLQYFHALILLALILSLHYVVFLLIDTGHNGAQFNLQNQFLFMCEKY